MTTVIKPNPQQWEVLQELGLTAVGQVNIVLVAPEIQAALEEKFGDKLPDLESQAEDEYDCGGEADAWLDVAMAMDHCYCDFLEESSDEAE